MTSETEESSAPAPGGPPAARPTALLAPRRSAGQRLLRGAIAGLVAGLVELAFAMVALRLSGPGFWAPLKLAAAAVLGPAAVANPGFDLGPVLLGLVLFGLVSAALGALYGLLFRGISISPSLVIVGPVYGFAIWVIGFLFVLPRLDPLLLKQYTDWVLFVGDLLFGLALGAAYPIVRDTIAEREEKGG
jgi:hypothetical protein